MRTMPSSRSETDAIRRSATPLGRVEDLDPLLDRIGAARYVLLGGSTYGTSDFYRWRAEVTKRLIVERDFSFIAVEADWRDTVPLHRCLAGVPGTPEDPEEMLWNFDTWPRWIWANQEVADFVSWLREFNATRFSDRPVGFAGLDAYNLWDSARELVAFVEDQDPGGLDATLAALRCFDPNGCDTGSLPSGALVAPELESEVVDLLAARRRRTLDATSGFGERFIARRGAEIAAGADRYYRELLRGGTRAWNVRERHMVGALDRLAESYGPDAKAVVWAHDSHVGDARGSETVSDGMVTLGQLVRERHGDAQVVSVGFGSHRGSVVAAEAWGVRPHRMLLAEARPGSLEALLHDAVADRNSLFTFPGAAAGWFDQLHNHREVGMICASGTHRRGDGMYVPSVPSRCYDAFIHCDRTSALTPLRALRAAPVEARAPRGAELSEW